MAKDGLINCKKCGTLFFKTSEREVCDECFKKELDIIDDIKKYIVSSKKEKVTIEEITQNVPEANPAELEDLISRGRLFTILPKISVKCRFCGAELENDEKTGFTCKKCLMKFSPKMSELEKKGLKIKNYEEEARTLNRRLRGGMNSANTSTRYGFIQNYDL
ncbi:MAG: hypothetical protein IJ877_05645 [Candidatus Gastranaerophilales bacterium]|nr:hypothetical protein [Candidatus Gastranaerophilales bacterium]